MSSAEALKAGLRGKALRITHYYRDLLWKVLLELDCYFHQLISVNKSFVSSSYLFSPLLGWICRESVEGRHVPNAGFFEDVVFEDPSLSSSARDSDLTEVACETSIDQQNNTKSEGAEESLDVNELPPDSGPALATLNNDENDTEEITAGVADLKLPDTGSANDPNDQHTLSTSDVDSLLDKCLLQALHTTVKDKDLPMPGSTLW